MRLPGAQKNAEGKVTAPGHMLIFTAGNSPIYGMQILYFLDPVFSRRARIPAPGIISRFPAGITDSLYHPRPLDWYGEGEAAEQPEIPKTAPEAQPEKRFVDFLEG